ncbi:uncharacterized protein LOC132617700 isoform X2 [Lycium barbarum]|uniref:uncharacterized protein LOC132617700 isoform X2 n=1 Tax=Lycium barbarum TaxID=112863 RepID=UPI00293F26B5|nr:uncharacterized protein LOC132617700 isoform X2 [Lycium barbarum]
MDTSKIAHQVGQAQGQAQEKGSQLMEKTGNVVQSTKETMQQMVPQAKENYHAGKAQGQAEVCIAMRFRVICTFSRILCWFLIFDAQGKQLFWGHRNKYKNKE